MRIWIEGPEGPSHDFELLETPRIGEVVSISCDGKVLEGVVAGVRWQLRAIDHAAASASDLTLGAEPAGSVVLVNVICAPRAGAAKAAVARDEIQANDAG